MKIFIGGLSFSTTDDTLHAYFKTYGTITDAVVMKDSLSRRSRGFGFITFANPSSVDDVLNQPEHIIDNRRVEAKRAVPRVDTGKAPDPASGITRTPVLPTMNGGDGGETHTTSSDSVLPGSPTGVRGVVGPATDNSGDALWVGHQQQQTAAGFPCAKIFVGGLHYDTRDSQFRSYFEKFGKVVSAEVMFNRETRKSRGFGFVVFESADSASAVLQSTHHTIGSKLVEVKPAIPRMPCQPGTTTTPRVVGPMPLLSPDHSIRHSSQPFPNGPLRNSVSDGTLQCFGGGTYATAVTNGLTHIQRGGTGGTQQQQLQPGQETQAPLFPPQQLSSPPLYDKGRNVSRSPTGWRDIVNNNPFARSEEQVCHSTELEEEDIPPSTFLQQVLQNGQRQDSSTGTGTGSAGSFSPYPDISMDSIYGHHNLGTNLSPFLMGSAQPPLDNNNSSNAEQWKNPSKERTAEGMIEAAMADLNLGFGLQDDWDKSSDHTYAGIDLNDISPSVQTDTQAPAPPSIDFSVISGQFSGQRMQGSDSSDKFQSFGIVNGF